MFAYIAIAENAYQGQYTENRKLDHSRTALAEANRAR